MRECRMKIQQARNYALSLPETTEEPHFKYSSFRVCGKIFATLSPNCDYLHIFIGEDQRAPLIATQPDVFEALHWGSKVVGVRVSLAPANAVTVKRLLLESWTRKVPKRLAATMRPAQQ